jgi:hypothetical protein
MYREFLGLTSRITKSNLGSTRVDDTSVLTSSNISSGQVGG